MENFESLHDRKMKNGRYQLGLGVIGAIMNLLDGSYFTIMPFCVRFIQMDYALTNGEASLLSSILLAGSIVAGPLTATALHHFGRKFTITFSSTIGVLIGVAFYYTNSFWVMILSTGVLGMYMMSVIAALMLYLVESITGPNKGKAIVGVYSFFSIGRLFGTISARLTLTPYQFDYWKVPIFINCMILLVAYLLILFVLRESVKFSYHKRRLSQVVEDFNAIQRFNHPEEYLRQNDMLIEMKELKACISLSNLKTDDAIDREALISQRRRRRHMIQTVVFTASIVCSLYVNIIHTMIVPNIMGTDSASLTGNIIIMSGELIGVALMLLFIENQFVGRRRIVLTSHFLMVGIFLSHIFFPRLPITMVMYVAKIFIKTSLSTSFIHLNESFPISVRARSVMIVTTLANVSTIGCPFLFFEALNHGVNTVFGLAAFFAGLGFLIDLFMHSDLKQDKSKRPASEKTNDVEVDPMADRPEDEAYDTVLAEQKLN